MATYALQCSGMKAYYEPGCVTGILHDLYMYIVHDTHLHNAMLQTTAIKCKATELDRQQNLWRNLISTDKGYRGQVAEYISAKVMQVAQKQTGLV